MRDVGRQRHVAVALHQSVRLVAQDEAKEGALGIGPASGQRGGEAAVHCQRRAHGRLLADLHVCHHLALLQHALDQQLDLATGWLLAVQARLDHLGVVEDQQVAGIQQGRQVAKDAVGRRGKRAVKQARGAAFRGRVLGNEFFGKREVEIAEGKAAHGA